MKPICVKNAIVVQPGERAEVQTVLFAERIAAILPNDRALPPGTEIIDGRGKTLTPGTVDLHTHGIGTYLYELSPDDLVEGLKLPPKFGCTTVLPTLYSTLKPSGVEQIAKLTAAMAKVTSVHVPGFHMEGPFLALAGAGGSTLPVDLKFLDELLAAAQNKVTVMSLSPEVSGITKVIERLVSKGITPFITHTRASVEQTQVAIDAGARHATHFYDVFPHPEPSDPGVHPTGAIEVFLGDARSTVDVIADGVHVHPVAIRAAVAAKGTAGMCAITDSNIGAGLPDGVFDTTWGYPVRTSATNATRIADPNHPLFGALAGSNLTMNRAVQNLHRWIHRPTQDIWAMATANPARVAKLEDRGVIRLNAHADLVLWNEDFTPYRTWLGGRVVYSQDNV